MSYGVLSLGDKRAAIGESAESPSEGLLRTSSYTIYVDLRGHGEEMLLVHGYTGASNHVSRRVGLGEVAEEHRHELGPALTALRRALGSVLLAQSGEVCSRDLPKQLTEEAGAAYHDRALRRLPSGMGRRSLNRVEIFTAGNSTPLPPLRTPEWCPRSATGAPGSQGSRHPLDSWHRLVAKPQGQKSATLILDKSDLLPLNKLECPIRKGGAHKELLEELS